MSARFYLPFGGTPPVTPTPSSQWVTTTSFVASPTGTAKTNTALTAGTARTHSATNLGRRLDRQFVSGQYGTGSVSGTFSAVVKGVESNALNNAWLDVVIRVVDSTGAVERGVLYAGSVNTTASATASAENFELPTTVATRIKNAITLSPVSMLNGDRIVFEVGAQYNITNNTTYTVTLTYGDPTATADYALTAALTTTLCPWVELSATLPALNNDLPNNSTALVVTAGLTSTGQMDSQSGTDASAITVTLTANGNIGRSSDSTALAVVASVSSGGSRSLYLPSVLLTAVFGGGADGSLETGSGSQQLVVTVTSAGAGVRGIRAEALLALTAARTAQITQVGTTLRTSVTVGLTAGGGVAKMSGAPVDVGVRVAAAGFLGRTVAYSGPKFGAHSPRTAQYQPSTAGPGSQTLGD